MPEPFGVVFVNGIWNYPFATTFPQIAGAIAAGNNVILKPCQTSGECCKLICDLVHQYVDPFFVQVIGHKYIADDYTLTDKILENRFDYIVFTGSTNGGKYILSKAAPFLTPCLLELGGKNPVLIDECANLKMAAQQILAMKMANCGQSCVAPNMVFVHENKFQEFMEQLQRTHREWFGGKHGANGYAPIMDEEIASGSTTVSVELLSNTPADCDSEYVGHMVSKAQYERVVKMIQDTKGTVYSFDYIFGALTMCFDYVL